jgi:hypothetical protein
VAAAADLATAYRKRVSPHLDSAKEWERHGAQVLDAYLAKQQSDYEDGDRYYSLRHTAGIQDDVRDIFDLMDMSSEEAWSNIATRLETADQPLAGWRATLEEGRVSGHLVARRQAESAMEQFRHLAGPKSKWLGLAAQVAGAVPKLSDRLAMAVDKGREAASEFASYIERTTCPMQSSPTELVVTAMSAPPNDSWDCESIRWRPTSGAGARSDGFMRR